MTKAAVLPIINCMKYASTVTQKGQITLPKALRKSLNIHPYERVSLEKDGKSIKVSATIDILDIAGTIKTKIKKSALEAREFFEKNYQRT